MFLYFIIGFTLSPSAYIFRICLLLFNGSDDGEKDDCIKTQDKHGWYCKNKVTQAIVHPTKLIFKRIFRINIRHHHHERPTPTKPNQTFLDKVWYNDRLGQCSQEDALTQHPEVGRHHEVSCDGVHNPTQDEGVPDVVEDQVQQQPGDIVEAHCQEQVLVDRHPSTVKSLECVEDCE